MDEITEAELDQAVSELPARMPPPGFADRVLAARRPRRWPAVVAVAALAAAVALLVLPRGPAPTSGRAFVEARQSITLGARGRAVAEAGAELRWRVDARGAALAQPRGAVFYRVDGEGPFVVETPGGEVLAQGTCFKVEIEMKNALKGAVIGAAVTAAVLVTVYEGRVEVKNAKGSLKVSPGEQARFAKGSAPTLRERARPALAPSYKRPVRVPEPPPQPEPPPTEVGQSSPEEVAELRAEVKRLRGELEQEVEMRKETEGDPVAFPEDLPEDFREEGLVRNFKAGLEELGLDYEIMSVDCSEYPCIIYGDVENPTDDVFKRLAKTEAFEVYKKDTSNHTSSWGRKVTRDDGTEEKRAFFGVSLNPSEKDPTTRSTLNRRTRFRNQQAFEAFDPRQQ